jgi:hypothetical protein
MKKFVTYEKLSKQKKRELDKRKRGTWGPMSPVTRRPRDPKAYVRKKTRENRDEPLNAGSFSIHDR